MLLKLTIQNRSQIAHALLSWITNINVELVDNTLAPFCQDFAANEWCLDLIPLCVKLACNFLWSLLGWGDWITDDTGESRLNCSQC
jgi:hypothetical protein